MSDSAFRLLQSDATNMRVYAVDEREFTLSVRRPYSNSSKFEKIAEAHQVILCFLIALNVGALGAFTWADKPWVHPIFSVTGDMEGASSYEVAMVGQSVLECGDLKPLNEADVRDAVLIFRIIAKERTSVLIGEYARGLLLLDMSFAELNFRREAYMCFYRALENFITVRVLQVTRLANELKDMQRGLQKLIRSQEIIDEFRSIYLIRSSQAAHSQGRQREISVEEVRKVKVFLDMVMNTEFRRKANEILRSQRECS